MLDEPAQGLRLLRRAEGFEAQQWSGGELLHSRWFEALPDAAEWQRFVRGCGADPDEHPLPEPTVAAVLRRPARGWLAGDNLPAVDPWQGWRWRVALLLLGTVGGCGPGRAPCRLASSCASTPNACRPCAAAARPRCRPVRATSRPRASSRPCARWCPRLSQLELLERVTASGIFASARGRRFSDTRQDPGQSRRPACRRAPAATGSDGARMLEWDYRNGQLKITLELPDRDVTLLDVTRKLESVPGLGALRVGQDSAGNTLTLSANIAELAPPTDAPRPGIAAR